MVISAQWELVRGNSYGYTVLSAFGLFYAGFGAISTPILGIASVYGDDKVQYNNALGFFVLRRYHNMHASRTLILTTSASMVGL